VAIKFSNLLDLKFDLNTEVIDLYELRKMFPNTPEDVLSQFYSDHGRKNEFQSEYANIEIDLLQWNLMEIVAETIVKSSMHPNFHGWFESVSNRVKRFSTEGWESIDCRVEVREHWRIKRTWIIPPVFLDGQIIGSESKFHLVEGHTRVGILDGFLKHDILSENQLHTIWVATQYAT
jgi:hypothetical protein